MKYQEVILYIEKLIKDKTLMSGSKLPDIKVLASTLNYSTDSVLKAYEIFKNKKIVYTIDNIGYFLMNNPEKKLPSESIDFTSGNCYKDFLSLKEYKDIIYNMSFDYENNEIQGLYKLRKNLKKYFTDRKILIDIENIIISSNIEEAYFIILNSILKNNESLLIENPTTDKIMKILRYNEINKKIFTFNRDEKLDLNVIEYYFIKNSIKMIFITTNTHIPTGSSLTLFEKNKLLELCYKYKVYIIENNHLEDIDLYDDTQSLYALDKHNIVFHIKEFSTLYSSVLKLSTLIVPSKFTNTIIEFKNTISPFISLTDQNILNSILDSELFKNRKNEIALEINKKLNFIKEKFKNIEFENGHSVIIPEAGNFILLKVSYDFSIQTMVNDLLNQNIYIENVEKYFYKEYLYKGFIISFGNVDYDKIDIGIKVIIDYLKKY